MDLYARQAVELLERRRADEALRASEERLRRYFDLGLIGMAITTPAKGCLEVNGELCRILGYERNELLRKTWAEMTHHDDLAADVAQFNRVLAGEIDGYTLDKRWIRRDGLVIDSITAAKCVRRADGSVDYFIGLVQDITERKRAEEKLAESERRFRLLVESIPHHVWSLRPDGTGGYVNQRRIDYTGIPGAELRRGGGWAALHPDDLERVKAAWATAFANGTDCEMEQRVRGRDGGYRRFVCRAVVVKDEQGRVLEWFGTDTDVEDRRQAEESLTRARFELARVMRVTTMGELAASIAHELNQPLAVIATSGHAAARWLSAQPPNLREANDALERIIRDSHRAADVITHIRAFLKGGPAQRSEVDLDDVIAEVTAMVQWEISSRGVSLIVTKGDALSPARADPVQLQQVMLNLLMNAIDAMSSVTDRARVLEIGISRHGSDALLISVRDSGKGIPSEERDRVFEPFHTTKSNGMGMGLTISRSIVEAHGGRLWVTPNEGPGETFEFTLPLMPLAG
jgi:PAS domain S-box-containing protein